MEGFNPEAYLAKASADPQSEIPVDTTQIAQFDPVSYAQKANIARYDVLQKKYGGLKQQAAAALEGGLRGITLGASDFANSTPEQQAEAKARMEANPWSSGIGQVVGGGALLGLTGGLAAPVEAGLVARGVGGLAARTLGYGAEGAVFGAGNAVSDAALGEPNLSAQKILTHIGMGAALGGGLGALSSGIEAIPALVRRAGATESNPVSSALSSEPTPIVDAPSYKGVKPTSFEEIADRVEKARKSGVSTELPEKAELLDAISRVEMENPVHPLQSESLTSQEHRDLYKMAQEFPGEQGKAFREYESIQKQELVGKTDKAIEDISPSTKPTPDATEGGNRAIDAFTEQYQAEKEALSPVFKKLKETPLSKNVDHLPGAITAMTDAVPGISQMFDTTGAEIAFKPYKTSWGIDESTYKAVKQAVEALQDSPSDFQGLSNVRKGLSQHVDILAQGEGPGQIRALKASLMDYIQKAVQEVSPDIEVRGAFQRYAINEQERQVIEKAFGASVGNKDFGLSSKVKPETILDRVFGNTANVKAAKAILEPEKFNEMLANWMSENRAKVTDKGTFSSNKFASFIRRNQDALNAAFSDNPAALKQIKDMTTIMRILPDSPSINPSGTAKTLWSKMSLDPFKIAGGVAGHLKEKIIQSQNVAKVNAALSGTSDQVSKINWIKKSSEKVSDAILSASKSVVSGVPIKSVVIPSTTTVGDREYKSRVDKVKEFNNDPNAMMNHLSDSTQGLAIAAPNVTQSIHSTMMNAVGFLNSKIPKPTEQMTFSAEFNPSDTQKRTFNHYYDVVSSPLSSFREVSNGTISSQTMEALKAVHPQLLQEMQKQVFSQLKPEQSKVLNYSQKIALSKFLESPLDENMTPGVVLSNQQVFSIPSQSVNAMPQEGKRKTPLGPMKNIQIAKRTATQTRDQEET